MPGHEKAKNPFENKQPHLDLSSLYSNAKLLLRVSKHPMAHFSSFKSFFYLWYLQSSHLKNQSHLTPLLPFKVFLLFTSSKMPSSPPQISPKINTPPHQLQLTANPARQMRPESEAPPRKKGLLRPRHRTNPMIWCAAVVCVIFSLLLIFAGIVTLIFFLAIKPRNPSFDTIGATLNSVYLDSPAYLNSDLTFLSNFSNPNHKIDVMFEYLSIELYFYDRLLSTQALQPFAQRRGESRLESVHMISSEVYLPPELIMELQDQVRRNRVVYNIRGNFKVKVSVGVGHLSYWLYGRCQIELTAPPSGVLVAKSCRTKR